MSELNPRRQRFVEEYLVDLNATAAAIRAGYSAKTANVQGTQLLGNLSIRKAINAGKKARSQETKIDAAYILKRLKEEAELTGEGSRASARVKALELLGKHIHLFPSIHEHRHEGTVGVRLEIVEEIVDSPAPDPG